MSGNNSRNKSNSPLIATIIVGVLAVAAVTVLIFMLIKPAGNNDSTSDSGFVLTHEFEQECQYAAHDLVSQSFEVMRLFVFEGLSYMSEPYGNEPEDGMYTVAIEENSHYSSLEDIEKLVKSVYTDSAAEKIMHDIDGNGFEVYKNRRIFSEAEYDSEAESGESRPMYIEKEVLGIDAEFIPDATRRDLWASCSLMITPTSETSCDIKVFLGGVDESTDLSAVDESRVRNLRMEKIAGNWRLAEFVY